MVRHPFVALMLASSACVPPSAPTVVYYVPAMPVVPVAAYPPAPFPYAPPEGYPSRAPTPGTVDFVTPSLAVRNLAMKISESASRGDCATAKQTGDELERIDQESHHALLAVDARYASCIRGF